MIKKLITYLCVFCCAIIGQSQNSISVKADVNPAEKSIKIEQTIQYQNTSNDTLREIYLNDWNNSYSSKTTPLAKRFEEEFSTRFHLAKSRQRGYTVITSLSNDQSETLDYQRLKKQQDVIKVTPKTPILPNSSYTLNLTYTIVLPDASFTEYGFTDDENFELRYWYILPAVYDGTWNYASNKDLEDLFVPKADVSLQLRFPKNYSATSELDIVSSEKDDTHITLNLKGNDRTDTYLSLHQNPEFSKITTDDFMVISDIYEKGLEPQDKALITDKITKFLVENLGEYPFEKLLVSRIDYDKNPLYGINQLPSFLRPFKSQFQYEMKLLKTALKKYLANTHHLNPRKEHWLNDGIKIYFLMKYVEEHYPDMKYLGSLANIWGIRAFHIADLDYNFQYYLYSMEMMRRNNDQPLSTPKDSLIKFNANIASKYKAGIGLNYLDKYTEGIDFKTSLKDYLSSYKLKPVTTKDFENFIKSKTTKDINWFFDDYIKTRKKIDFKIREVTTTEDSITLTIKNKRDNPAPVPLFSLRNDSIVNTIWIDSIKGTKTLTIPNYNTDRLALDYENIIPELNQRDNYRSTTGSRLWSKPLQFRIFKDVEDPYYNQVFLMPLVEFNNIYDGLTLGTKIYNKTILRKRFNYRFSPQYATRSKALTGSGTVFYTHNIEGSNLFDITYGISAGYQSFAQDAFFTSIRPNITFSFRDNNDFRKDTRDRIQLRYVGINRDIGEDAIIDELDDEPDYGVFNLRYSRFTPGLINYSRFLTDFQVSSNFSKVALNYEIRKLSKNNRNYNLRFFAGAFLKNNTDPNSDFFSFALDRPTDYLFDLNYLGRSEASGLFSQQIIIAEGGFKSQLDTPFANQWMTTINGSTSIWRYIQAYGDIGLIKNRGFSPKFVYDTGIRLNLVEDYFEIFFPIYSNNGWEIAQPNYDQRIRFMFTVDPQVLLSLFTRKWF